MKILYRNPLGAPVHYLPRCASVMDIAHAMARGGEGTHGAVIATAKQTAGRGQRGRVWMTPPHRALLCAMLLRPSALTETQLQTATLRAACAVHKVIQRILGRDAPSPPPSLSATAPSEASAPAVRIRWPNDILVGRRKICGILTEYRGDGVVVGIGLNCTQRRRHFPPAQRLSATSLRMCGAESRPKRPPPSAPIAPRALLPLVIAALCREIASADDGWRRYINAHLWENGRTVEIRPASPPLPFRARLDGIEPDGALRYLRGATVGRLHAGSIRPPS